MSILLNKNRVGNITSSGIVDILSNGKTKGEPGNPFYTYIEECNMERRLGRSIGSESNARPLVWGKLVEDQVFNNLGLEYTLCSHETIEHPHISCWHGSPDAIKPETVVDVKSPMTLKSFCQLVDPIYNGLTGIEAMNEVRKNHKDGEKFYWQLTSNAILTKSKYAELIVYVPYKKELNQIKELAREKNDDKYWWIIKGEDIELPYLIEKGYYKNLNVIRFEVPQKDIDFLTERVLMAQKLLINV